VFHRSIIAAFTFFDLYLLASMKDSMEGGFPGRLLTLQSKQPPKEPGSLSQVGFVI
jgi:hypothetical protein